MVVVIVRVVCFFIGVGGGKFKGIELKGREDRVDQLCWDPKHADLIATASGNKTVRMWPVWDVCSGKCSHQAELRGENINITYKPDGTHIAVCNRLKIKNCEKLQYLVDQREDTYTSSSSSSAMHMENINSSSVALLEKLSISPCPSLTCIFLKGQFPASLKHLKLKDCSELTILSPRDWLLEAIENLLIEKCPSLKSIAERLTHHLDI
ncbi:hypothetical protein ACOSQ2_030342 [Xanthoceras sorbifolium]